MPSPRRTSSVRRTTSFKPSPTGTERSTTAGRQAHRGIAWASVVSLGVGGLRPPEPKLRGTRVNLARAPRGKPGFPREASPREALSGLGRGRLGRSPLDLDAWEPIEPAR